MEEKKGFTIQLIIDNWLRKEEEEMKQEAKYFYASDLGYCERKTIYRRKNTPQTNPPDNRGLRIFSVGHIFHEWVTDKILKNGILLAAEQEIINEKYNYKGRFDALVKADNKKILYDFKTQRSDSFHYLVREGGPKKEHILQITSYATMGNIKPDESRILYISKDDLLFAEYTIKTELYEDEVREELKSLNQFLKEDTLPPQITETNYGKPNWKCRYCPYKDLCRGKDWEGKILKEHKKPVKKHLEEFLSTKVAKT